MKRIIEIGGIDASGKTTQIKNLLNHAERMKNLKVCVAPKRIPLESKFPDNLRQRIKWYLEAPLREIVGVNFSSKLKRDDINEKLNYDIILEDRGFYTIYTSMIARTMHRENTNFLQAKEFVDGISNEKGFNKNGSTSYVLHFKNWKTAKTEIRKRMSYLDEDFERYLEKFYLAMNKVIFNAKGIEIIDTKDNPNSIGDELTGRIFK